MKNASKHAAALKSLFRKLIRQHRPPPRPQVEPLRAIVMGVLAEQCDEARAHKAMEVFEETFVDINELRVATELELASMIGNRYPAAPERAVRMREIQERVGVDVRITGVAEHHVGLDGEQVRGTFHAGGFQSCFRDCARRSMNSIATCTTGQGRS